MTHTLVIPAPTEAAFTAQVLQLAKLLGWRTAHFRPARTAQGWRTPVSGDGVGFPDLILIRGPVLLAVELKIGRNKPTPEQAAWLAAFDGVAGSVWVKAWTPADWPEIEETLKRE